MNNFDFTYLLSMGAGLLVAAIAVAIWSVVWKIIAVWKAARNGHKGWYGVLFFLNTMGILEILYIYVFSKKRQPPTINQ